MKFKFCLIALLMTTITFSMKITSSENESLQLTENLASLNRNERKNQKGTTVKTKRTTTTTKNTNTNKAGKTLGKTSITRKNKIKNLNLLKTKDAPTQLMEPLLIYNDIIKNSEIKLTKTEQVKDPNINKKNFSVFDLQLDPKTSNEYVNKNNAILVYLVLKEVYSKFKIAIMFYPSLPIDNSKKFSSFEDGKKKIVSQMEKLIEKFKDEIVFEDPDIAARLFVNNLVQVLPKDYEDKRIAKLARIVYKALLNNNPVDFCYKQPDLTGKYMSKEKCLAIKGGTKKAFVDGFARNKSLCGSTITNMVLAPIKVLTKCLTVFNMAAEAPEKATEIIETTVDNLVTFTENITTGLIDTSIEAIGEAFKTNLRLLNYLNDKTLLDNMIDFTNNILERHYSKLMTGISEKEKSRVFDVVITKLKDQVQDQLQKLMKIDITKDFFPSQQQGCTTPKGLAQNKNTCLEKVTKIIKMVDYFGISNVLESFNHQKCNSYSESIYKYEIANVAKYSNRWETTKQITVINLTKEKFWVWTSGGDLSYQLVDPQTSNNFVRTMGKQYEFDFKFLDTRNIQRKERICFFHAYMTELKGLVLVVKNIFNEKHDDSFTKENKKECMFDVEVFA